MKPLLIRMLKHLVVSIVALVAAWFAGDRLGVLVWMVLGNDPPNSHPLLITYEWLFWAGPLLTLVFLNYFLHRRETNRAQHPVAAEDEQGHGQPGAA